MNREKIIKNIKKEIMNIKKEKGIDILMMPEEEMSKWIEYLVRVKYNASNKNQ